MQGASLTENGMNWRAQVELVWLHDPRRVLYCT